ncbi:MAG: single-stranded DNA-binding protein [Oscillospiraceae bacterium]|nr:single-stranded DNA-binding protein [Oscillospiraceae bacterium]
MLNNTSLMGRLTHDPELRHTPNGSPVTSFSLACERDYSTNGDKETDFIDIVAWRKTAEFVGKYFKKGQLVAVTGRIQTRKWKDKEGNNRTAVEINADHVYFAEKKNSDATDFTGSGISEPSYNEPGSDFSELEIDDSELPF